MIPWLKYLMMTFLTAGAKAEGPAGFEDFTCDHVLNGMVVGSRRDNGELYAIAVHDNQVEVEMLWPGVKDWSTYPPLGSTHRRPRDEGGSPLIGVRCRLLPGRVQW
ncbi:hypothetical protein [Nocardioides sp.]|uniref:hypothetical protein n=1 Tax=Nocardioides sp. TaxID=35761 RepID=UPI00198D41E9|nr:hypothetical protein [Nocardioides sp.]MBC7277112.1 hypothetical protein [Nocardioides sp.]